MVIVVGDLVAGKPMLPKIDRFTNLFSSWSEEISCSESKRVMLYTFYPNIPSMKLLEEKDFKGKSCVKRKRLFSLPGKVVVKDVVGVVIDTFIIEYKHNQSIIPEQLVKVFLKDNRVYWFLSKDLDIIKMSVSRIV